MDGEYTYSTHMWQKQEQSGNDNSLQTSSILKMPKPRKPLQDIDNDESDMTAGRTYAKRVSFHKAVKTKEYHIDEAVTVWSSTYEETFKSSSESSHNTDNSSCPNSLITAYDHLLSTRASTASVLEKSSMYLKDAKFNKKDHFYGLSNTDENKFINDDEQCSPLNKIQSHPSVFMDLTHPFNDSTVFISKNEEHAHDSRSSDLCVAHYEIPNSKFLNAVYHELSNDADMELTDDFCNSHPLIRSNEMISQSMYTTGNFYTNLSSSSGSSMFDKGNNNVLNLNQSDISLTESVECVKDCGDNENNVSLEITKTVFNIEKSNEGFDSECNKVEKIVPVSEDQIVINSQILTNTISNNEKLRKLEIPLKNNNTLSSESVFEMELSIKEQPTSGGITVNSILRDISLENSTQSKDESDDEMQAILKYKFLNSDLNNDNRYMKVNESLIGVPIFNALEIPSLQESKKKSSLSSEEKNCNSDKNDNECTDVSELEFTCNNNVIYDPLLTANYNCMDVTDALKQYDILDYEKLRTSELTNTSEEISDKSSMNFTCNTRVLNAKLQNSELLTYSDEIICNMQLSDNMKEKKLQKNTNLSCLDITGISRDILDKTQSFKEVKATESCDLQVALNMKKKEISENVNLQPLELTRIHDVSDISQFTCYLKGCTEDAHVDEMILDQSINEIDNNSPKVLNASEMEFPNEIHLLQSDHLEMKLNECEKEIVLPREVFGISFSTFSGLKGMNLTTDENKKEMKRSFKYGVDDTKTMSTKRTQNGEQDLLDLSNKLEIGMDLINKIQSKETNKINRSDSDEEKLRTCVSYSPASSVCSMSMTDVLEVVSPVIDNSSDVGNVHFVLLNPDSDKQNNRVSQNNFYDDSGKCNKNMNCEKSVVLDISEKLNKSTDSCHYMKSLDEKAISNIKEHSSVPESFRRLAANSFMNCDDTKENSLSKETHPEETNLMKKLLVETINDIDDFLSNKCSIDDKQYTKESHKTLMEHHDEIIEHDKSKTCNSDLDTIQISLTSHDTSTIKNSKLEAVVCDPVAMSPVTANTSVFIASDSSTCSDKQNVIKRSSVCFGNSSLDVDKLLKLQEINKDVSYPPKYRFIEKTEIQPKNVSESNLSITETIKSSTVDSIKNLSRESELLVTGVKFMEIDQDNILMQSKENSVKEHLPIQSCNKISVEESPTNMMLDDSTKCTSIPVKTIELNNSVSMNLTKLNIKSPMEPSSCNINTSELSFTIPNWKIELKSAEIQNYMELNIFDSVGTEKVDNISLLQCSIISDEIDTSPNESCKDGVECVKKADKNIREISNVSVTNNSILSSSAGISERKETNKKYLSRIEKENMILMQSKENSLCSSDELNKSMKEHLPIQSCTKISVKDSPRNVMLHDYVKCNKVTTSIPVKSVELNKSVSINHTELNIKSPIKPSNSNINTSELNLTVSIIREKDLSSLESQNYMELDISESEKPYVSVETEKEDSISLLHSSFLSDKINTSTDELYEYVVECVKEADRNITQISNLASVTNKSILSSSLGICERKEMNKNDLSRIESGLDEKLTYSEGDVIFTKNNSKVKCHLSGNDSQNRDVTVNILIEDQIKTLQLRSEDEWIIKEQSETLWSYLFLYNSLELVIRLGEIVDDVLSTRVVTDIQLISYAIDTGDPLVKFVHRSLLQELQIEELKLKCKTTEYVVEILSIVLSQISDIKIFMRDFIELESLEMAELKDNCVVFDVAEMDICKWFRIQVNLDHWKDILPADVSIENIIGKTSEEQMKRLVTGAVRGPGCLLDYTRIVKKYVQRLPKNNLS